MNDKIRQRLKDLPSQSGVYIMYSKEGQILYIGKAKVLKNRVRQYFQNNVKTIKVMKLVEKIDDFRYIITNNEIEALVLENNLIKKHKPPYNILLKDDKNYPFIRINLKDEYPRIEVVRRLKEDGAKYFGPYMQGISTRELLDILYSTFPIRECKLNFAKIPRSHRPCLNYHIGRCMAPCMGYISSEEYRSVVDKVIDFLNGNDREVLEILNDKMTEAATREDFELAMYYRDRLNVLDKLVRKQITAMPKDINVDIFAIASNGFNTVVATLMVRGGKLLGGNKEVVMDVNSDDIVLANYIVRYYDSVPLIAHEVVTAIDIDSGEIVEQYLTEKACHKVNVISPKQGIRRQLADMAKNNALDYLEKCVSLEERRENMTIGGMVEVQERLGLDRLPMRIECYDISNISGTDKVASMVVFVNGEPEKSHYRRFKIKTVKGSNDFASMKEVITRRFLRYREGKDISFGAFPDLVIIDGGLGQLEYTSRALKELGIDNLNYIGLAEKNEEIYFTGQREPIVLDKNNYGLRLLQRVRDEAHRFAITFHRNLRLKRQTASVLMEKIDGMGQATFDAIMARFKSMDGIKSASLSDIESIPRINKKVARRVYDYFHAEQ